MKRMLRGESSQARTIMLRRVKIFLLGVAIFGFVLGGFFYVRGDLVAEKRPDENASKPAENLTEQILEGKRLYYTAFGETAYACIFCHANFDEEKLTDGYQRPGHQLFNSYFRKSYYNGAYQEKDKMALIRAINTCISAWLEIEPLKADDEKMLALLSYLKSISPAESEEEGAREVKIEKVEEYPSEAGDARRGEKLFESACVLCHREKGAADILSFQGEVELKKVFSKIRGVRLAEEPVKKKAEEENLGEAGASQAQSQDEKASETLGWESQAEKQPKPKNEITEQKGDKVRFKKRFGKMPFFSAGRLSQQEVADILAYIEWLGQTTKTSEPGETQKTQREAEA